MIHYPTEDEALAAFPRHEYSSFIDIMTVRRDPLSERMWMLLRDGEGVYWQIEDGQADDDEG